MTTRGGKETDCRGGDNEEDEGDKAEVDDQPDVEEGEVADWRHLRSVVADQGQPVWWGIWNFNTYELVPHMSRSMNMLMVTRTTRVSCGM